MVGDRDRAALLVAARDAADALADRVDAVRGGLTVTLSVDEAGEIAEQFSRVVAMLWESHLASADPVQKPGRRPKVA